MPGHRKRRQFKQTELPLTPPNRRQRLEWCRARSTWMTEWHRVMFSDESRFCLSSDSRRVRVWRRRGERSNPAAIVERPTVRQRGIMGTMTAQRYVDDVLRPVTLPYLQGVPNALYQQDNARPHTARISQQALQDVQMLPWPPYSPDLSPIEHVWNINALYQQNNARPHTARISQQALQDVQMLPWPPYSPDLSPIEHVWDIIGRRLHALPQPRSEDELWQMVEREWRAIPQDAIRNLIDSLPRRVAACIAVRGVRLYECRQHQSWTQNQWAPVLFGDESRFSLNTDSRCVLIWRETGNRNHPSNIRERDHYSGQVVMVWGGIMLDARTPLHVFDGGTLTSQRYKRRDTGALCKVFLEGRGVRSSFIFMDDNARPHRVLIVNEYLESEGIQRMKWSARSLDINPIEHVWDALGRQIGSRSPSLITTQELKLPWLKSGIC
ncbi:SNQ2 [Cordylochernes scorpioides]|uniref:SNQ2 n=1 Tax=Cordylochernes scorpioides TaxID=51811 RepID=A0ABY6LB79_9ARAC|nr:SNQ2 [Cordylochernes scorpioides]